MSLTYHNNYYKYDFSLTTDKYNSISYSITVLILYLGKNLSKKELNQKKQIFYIFTNLEFCQKSVGKISI